MLKLGSKPPQSGLQALPKKINKKPTTTSQRIFSTKSRTNPKHSPKNNQTICLKHSPTKLTSQSTQSPSIKNPLTSNYRTYFANSNPPPLKSTTQLAQESKQSLISGHKDDYVPDDGVSEIFLDESKNFYKIIDSQTFIKKWKTNNFSTSLISSLDPTHSSHPSPHKQQHITQQILHKHDPRPTVLVDNPECLEIIIELLSHSNEPLAMDLEFGSDRSFLPSLELMQLSTRHGLVMVLDVPKLHDNFIKMIEFLNKKSVILHGGKQDIQVLNNLQFQFDIPCKPLRIYDTQIMASYIGITPHQIGLGKLISQLTGINLPKGLSFSDWSTRPLTTQQLQYSANDVRYLHIAFDIILEGFEKLDDFTMPQSLDKLLKSTEQRSKSIKEFIKLQGEVGVGVGVEGGGVSEGEKVDSKNAKHAKNANETNKHKLSFKRFDIMMDELETFSNSATTALQTPDSAWVDIVQNSVENFDENQLEVLKHLAKWRQITAYRRNQRPTLVIPDKTLIYLAMFQPTVGEIEKQFGTNAYVRANAQILKHLMDATKDKLVKPIVDESKSNGSGVEKIDHKTDNKNGENDRSEKTDLKEAPNPKRLLNNAYQTAMFHILYGTIAMIGAEVSMSPEQLCTHQELRHLILLCQDYYRTGGKSHDNNNHDNHDNHDNHNNHNNHDKGGSYKDGGHFEMQNANNGIDIQQESNQGENGQAKLLDIDNLPDDFKALPILNGFKKDLIGRSLIGLINGQLVPMFKISPHDGTIGVE
jgi:ribonuclease D